MSKISVFSSIRDSGHFRLMYSLSKKLGPISREKQLEWIKSIQTDASTNICQQYLKNLYILHWKLVYSMVKKYQNIVGFDSVYTAGCIGLLNGIYNFKLEKSTAISTVFVIWIKREIFRALNDERYFVAIPLYMYNKIRTKIKNTVKTSKSSDICIVEDIFFDDNKISTDLAGLYAYQQKLVGIYEDSVYSDEKALNVLDDKKRKTAEVQNFKFNTYNSSKRAYISKTEASLTTIDIRKDVQKAVNSIPSFRDRYLVTRLYGLDGNPPNTLQELGEENGVTKEAMRIRIKGIRQKYLRRKLLAYATKKELSNR